MLTCASCGEQNPERARFCLNCGAPLASEQRRGARKVVTVVVCDVTGSTALGERLDPESLGRVMARYFERTRTVLERHHGLVQKFIGDAVVAVFGVPVVREDDALRAVRAAAAMQDAVAELDPEGGPALEVRIGVSTGEVMVEEAGGDPLVIGEAVNLATRLQAAAGPGEVLLDRRTWHLSRDALVAAEVVGAPVDGGAWRLVDVSPDALGHARHLIGEIDTLAEGQPRGVVGAEAAGAREGGDPHPMPVPSALDDRGEDILAAVSACDRDQRFARRANR